MRLPRESSKLWVADDQGDLELLRGRYHRLRFAPHTHDSYSLAIITGGVLQYDHRGSVSTAPAGTISVIEPGEVHTGHAGADIGWTYRNFFVGAQIMLDIANDLDRGPNLPSFPIPEIHDPGLFQELLDLHRTLEISSERLERDGKLAGVFGRLISRHSSRKKRVEPTRDRPAVSRARRFIRDTLEKNISLESVASIAGYSPCHFLRLFRCEVGLTPHAFKLQVRIEKALELIGEGMSLAETAFACGFADQSHLTRRFRQVMGVTPGQYASGRLIRRDSAA